MGLEIMRSDKIRVRVPGSYMHPYNRWRYLNKLMLQKLSGGIVGLIHSCSRHISSICITNGVEGILE